MSGTIDSLMVQCTRCVSYDTWQGVTFDEDETPLSPIPIPAHGTTMEVDDTLSSSPSQSVEQAKKTGNRPSLPDILQGKEEIRKDTARRRPNSTAEMPEQLAADLRAIEKVLRMDGRVERFYLLVRKQQNRFETRVQVCNSKYAIVLQRVNI